METDRSGKMRKRVVLLIPEKSIICIQRTFLRWDGFRGLLYIYVLCSCCSFSLLRALAAEFGACARMMRGKSERYDGYCLGGVCAHGKDKDRLTSEGRGDSGTGNEESPREPDKLDELSTTRRRGLEC